MIIDKLNEDMKTALKSGEKDRLATIRMLISEIKNARIERGGDMTDEDEAKVIASYAKKRKEAIETARNNGREDLAEKEQAEYEVAMSYLPEQLDEAALRAIVERHISEAGGSGGQAFGQVMKGVMAEVAGKADGKVVSALVKEMMG